MKFDFFLICRQCGKVAKKEFNVSKPEMNKLIKLANVGLMLPQYLICPSCGGIKTVEVEVHKHKEE